MSEEEQIESTRGAVGGLYKFGMPRPPCQNGTGAMLVAALLMLAVAFYLVRPITMGAVKG